MKKVFHIVLLLVSTTSFAQTKLYVTATVGSYLMKENKDLQEDMLNELPESTAYKIVDEFPMSLQADLGIDIDLRPNDIVLGGYLNYTMTRGRIDYHDYSGELTIDQNMSRFVLGAKFMKHLGSGFWIYVKGGVVLSYLNITFHQKIYDTNNNPEDESYNFDALGFSGEPGLRWEHQVNRLVFFGQAGFEVNMNGNTHYEGDGYLQDKDGNPVTIDWTGARFGVGIGFRLQK